MLAHTNKRTNKQTSEEATKAREKSGATKGSRDSPGDTFCSLTGLWRGSSKHF